MEHFNKYDRGNQKLSQYHITCNACICQDFSIGQRITCRQFDNLIIQLMKLINRFNDDKDNKRVTLCLGDPTIEVTCCNDRRARVLSTLRDVNIVSFAFIYPLRRVPFLNIFLHCVNIVISLFNQRVRIDHTRDKKESIITKTVTKYIQAVCPFPYFHLLFD